MDKQQQSADLLVKLNNLPLHLLLSILPYLDRETKQCIKNNSTRQQFGDKNANHSIFLNLVSVSLFAEKYLTSTDRSVYFSFYGEPVFLQYQTNLIGELCVRDAKKYQRIDNQFTKLFNQVAQQLNFLETRYQLVQTIQNTIRDPEIPLPRMRKEGIAMNCNSSLQFSLADLRHLDDDGEQQQWVQDCVLDLQQFLETLQPNLFKILEEKILSQQKLQKPKQKGKKKKQTLACIKQVYYHPQILNLQNYQSYVIKQLTSFNMFVYLHTIISGIGQIYHEYVMDQYQQFERFIQFLMRYSIYRSMILSFESSKISKILYDAVKRLIERGQQIYQQMLPRQQARKRQCLGIKQENITAQLQQTQTELNTVRQDNKIYRIEQQVILEVDFELQNRISNQNTSTQKQQQASIEINFFQSVKKVSSQPVPQLEVIKTPVKINQNQCTMLRQSIEMSARLFIVGGKIWTNQNRRARQKLQQSMTISPSKFIPPLSQQTVNNRNIIKILNKLLHLNLLDKLKEEIFQQNKSIGNKKQGCSTQLRDQDIINIFGSNNLSYMQNTQAESPTHSNHSFTYSNGSFSPQNSSLFHSNNFSEIIGRSSKNFQNSSMICALMNVQNKIKIQPYRFQRNKQLYFNDTVSNSPQKEVGPSNQKNAQLQLNQNLAKLPSLRQRKLLSKASFISKLTKISQIKGISSIQDMFESETQIQQQILMEYHSFLIDLSVNELTVHWCGHSGQQLMGDYYHNFEEYVVKYNQDFMDYLSKICQQSCLKIQTQHKKARSQNVNSNIESTILKMLKNLLKWQLQYLDVGFVHKRTIGILLQYANQLLVKTANKYDIQQSQIQLISLNVQKIDQMIQHYNEQMWKIERNVSSEKLKIYQQRKSPRTIIQVCKFKQKETNYQLQQKQVDKNKDVQALGRRNQRKRRNSQNVVSLHSIQ